MNTKTLPMGLVPGLAARLYHSDPGVSNSMLSSMAKSPAHCWGLHVNPARPVIGSTDAMKLGTLAHCYVLEPEEVIRRYATKPEGMSFATKEGKAWRASVPPGIDIVSQGDMTQAQQQRAAIWSVPALRNLISQGKAEESAFWNDKATGLRCRARPDWLHFTGPKRAVVLDIKTIAELTPESVAKSVAKYGYHRQQAHYTAGVEACGIEVEEFVFGFVSSSYPYLAVAYVLDDQTRDQGVDEVSELLSRFAECQRSNIWPAFGDGYQLMSLPNWAKRETEVEISYATT